MQGAKQKSADEAGDKSAAADQLSRRKAKRGQGHDRHVGPMRGQPVVARGDAQTHYRKGAKSRADQNAEADFLQDDLDDPSNRVVLHLHSDRQIKEDDDQRHADSVIQPAFDIQGFARFDRRRLVGYNRRPERSVRRRQHRGKHGRGEKTAPSETGPSQRGTQERL